MIIKTLATTSNNNQEVINPNSLISVEIDLADIDPDLLVDYCVENLSVMREEDIMDNLDEYEIIDYLEEHYGTYIDFPFYYPNNSIRVSSAYRKLLENIDNIPIEKIEELIKDL